MKIVKMLMVMVMVSLPLFSQSHEQQLQEAKDKLMQGLIDVDTTVTLAMKADDGSIYPNIFTMILMHRVTDNKMIIRVEDKSGSIMGYMEVNVNALLELRQVFNTPRETKKMWMYPTAKHDMMPFSTKSQLVKMIPMIGEDAQSHGVLINNGYWKAVGLVPLFLQTTAFGGMSFDDAHSFINTGVTAHEKYMSQR